MTDKELFEGSIAPVMDEVMREMRNRQAAELRQDSSSLAAGITAGIGPDGGMTAGSSRLMRLRMLGEWSSKSVEDYVDMVRDRLKGEGITVTPTLEEMMIDRMVEDSIPRSSIEYVLRKAASSTLFGLDEEAMKTPLQHDIEARAERLYAPTPLEKGLGWGLGATADLLAMGSGSIMSKAAYVTADIALNAAGDAMERKQQATLQEQHPEGSTAISSSETPHIPLVLRPGAEQQWLEDQAVRKDTPGAQAAPAVQYTAAGTAQQPPADGRGEEEQDTQPSRTNTTGWGQVLSTSGLKNISDIGRNAGYILAMLPDMLLGMFTGRTQSLAIKDNMIPLASIIAGMLVRNPLLKMTLVGLGGATLLNKAGHEELERREPRARFVTYEDEPQNDRIRDTEIRGSTMVATIDGIPVTVTLPPQVTEAYHSGALPMGTLANAILRRCDEMQQIGGARERFEEESRDISRTLAQR